MKNSKIGWTEDTLNPIVGCTKVSDGCKNCYAEEMNKRFKWVKDWNTPEFFPKRLEQLNSNQKPRRIFLCSLSDMFHEWVKWSWLDDIFDKILECRQHTFLVLTKRPVEMKMFVEYYNFEHGIETLSNLWLGVTVENQNTGERIKPLLDTYASKHFISVEPMLSEIVIPQEQLKRIDWVIIGCESGQHRRECKHEWIQSLIEQCEQTKVPVFLKQLVIDGKLVKEPYFNGKQYLQYPE